MYAIFLLAATSNAGMGLAGLILIGLLVLREVFIRIFSNTRRRRR